MIFPTTLPETNATGIETTLLWPILYSLESQLFEHPPPYQQHTLLCQMPHPNMASSSRHLEHSKQTPPSNRPHPSHLDPTQYDCPTNLSWHPARPNLTGPPHLHSGRIHYDKTNMNHPPMGDQLPQPHVQPLQSSQD